MAVDLYCYVERYDGGRWRLEGDLVPNGERKFDPDAPRLAPSPVLHSVSKELAAILVDTGSAIRAVEPYTAIVPRRGKPHDLSPELAEYFRYFEGDDATVFSWFTARELATFDLSARIMTRQAYVPPEAAPLFAGCPFGFPLKDWPQGTPVSIAGWSRDGVEVCWRESYATIVQEFVDVVPAALAKSGTPDANRLVVVANW